MHIFGASGHAKVIIETLLSSGEPIEGIFDDNESIRTILGHPVLGRLRQEHHDAVTKMIIAIGDNRIRKKIASTLHFSFSNAIHRSAVLSPSSQIGHGVAIMANTTVNADTTIGDHVIINTSASIDHDCCIGDFAHIAPNSTICGGVHIGEVALIGAGTVIIPNIKIGNNVTVGAGAVITKDIPDDAVVVGNNKIINNG